MAHASDTRRGVGGGSDRPDGSDRSIESVESVESIGSVGSIVPPTAGLLVHDLGRMAYRAALDCQRRTHAAVLAGRQVPTLLLVEHDPVITISQRREARLHLRADPATLAALGIDVQSTDRGGDITYHGPGQLVAYPIIPLGPLGLNVGRYMRRLEQLAIDTVARFGLEARRLPGCTGVWIPGRPDRKLCALGVRVVRNVTMHGLALNVDPDLAHYGTIVPCGLADKAVTSMRAELGAACPPLDLVKATLVDCAGRHLARRADPARAGR